jgi:alpha-tubulin suppressor-like RCC1 family protein
MPCSRVPVEVKGLVATGLSAGGDHTCAVLADAGVACWGSNTHSQLGIATGKGPDRCETAGFAHGCASVPRKVERLESAAAVAAGGYHTCVLGRDAQVRCWGPNLMGQLSTGRQKGSANPVAAQGLSAVASLSAGLMHNCALASDGTVRCWGSNKAGQLGAVTGRAADAGAYSDEKRSTLPFSVKGLSDVASVSCGAEHSCAVLKNGTAACWGSNEHGKLGDGTTRNSVEPVVVRAGAGLVR